MIHEKLEEAIIEASQENDIRNTQAGIDLLIAATEALNTIKLYGEINIKQLMYDLARVSAAAGYVPDDFGGKEKNE
jgi:hypothetical protein